MSENLSLAMPKKRGRPPKYQRIEIGRDGKPVEHAKGKKVELTDEQVLDLVRARFQEMSDLTHGMVKGIVRSLIISGAPGVGKTYTLQQILDAAKEAGTRHEFVSGTLTAINLFRVLYRLRGPRDVLVLDDCDGVFLDENAMNILKAAVDTGKHRRISYLSDTLASGTDELAEGDVPQQFDYEGSIIFISNLDFDAYIAAGSTKHTRHMLALMNRSLYLDLCIHGTRELALWIGHILRTAKVFKVDNALTEVHVTDILAYLHRKSSEVRSLSIRTAIQCANLMKMKPDTWKKSADIVLLKAKK